MTSLPRNSPGDGRGHGTFVAGLAAGAGDRHAGAAPTAGIVSIDVMDDQGMARTSDVIAAAQWILRNKRQYNIRVANFSLHSATPSSFRWDPLDKAVEKLWFGGVVVVTSSGNYAEDGKDADVEFGPANDPFVITVGALDLHNSTSPDRASVGAVVDLGIHARRLRQARAERPGPGSGRADSGGLDAREERPSQVIHTPDGTYMELSGTSLSAPIVSGIAADLLMLRPDLTPDQVKGALMVAAQPVRHAAFHSAGVGEVFAPGALALGLASEPEPALNAFLDPDGGDGPVVRRRGLARGGAGIACLGRGLLARRSGRTRPGRSSPGATSPGGTSPGATSPGAMSPGAMSPGPMSPGRTCQQRLRRRRPPATSSSASAGPAPAGPTGRGA